jgi:SPP1 gp7 family putative phage head morphogenesis protein
MPEPPLVVSLADEFRQEILAREAAAVQEMAQRWLRIEAAIEAEAVALAEEIAQAQAAGQTVKISKIKRLERYRRLLAQLESLLSDYNGYAAGKIDQTATQNATQGLNDAGLLLDTVISENGLVGVAFDRLGIEAAENIVSIARAGQPLNQILERSYPLAVDAITDRLVSGVALGINPRQVARRMVQEGLAQGLNHILLVARDQGNRSYRLAGWQQYQQSGVVESYTRLAAKQPGRTCLACIALDGKVYPVAELMELHPQDRCSMVPNVRGLPRVQFESGESFFRSLDREQQREWMGPERFELWRSGAFEFKEMAKIVDNRTWGPSAQVRPVKELGS